MAATAPQRRPAMTVGIVMGLLSLVLALSRAPGAGAAALIPNGGFETASSTNPSLPASWSGGGWGRNTASYTWPSTGAHSGTRSARIDVSQFTDGGAKWSFDPQLVTPGVSYSYSSWYMSNRTTEILGVYTTPTGGTVYQWLADVPASAPWRQFTTTIVEPVCRC